MTRLGAAFLIAMALWLSGCAQGVAVSGPAAGPGASADVLTESDESPQRRRARLRTELAAAYFQQGQTLVALDEIKQALLADPAYADAHNLRGLVFLRLNDWPLAGESFQRALALRPGDPDALHNMGWWLCQQSRFAESDRLFAQAIAQPRYAQPGKTRVAQGVCQLRAGQPGLAEGSWLQALALDADNPVAAYQLAQLYFNRGDFQLAQPYMRKLNGGSLANAESLWLGIRIERQLNQPAAVAALVGQLRLRFAQSRELIAFDKGVFHE
jgi:type IV pilus assembly protein PilF